MILTLDIDNAGSGHLEHRYRLIKIKLCLNTEEDIGRVLLADAAVASIECSQRPEQTSTVEDEKSDHRSFAQDEVQNSRQFNALAPFQNHTFPVSDAKRQAFQPEPNTMDLIEEPLETDQINDEQYWITLKLHTSKALLRDLLLLPGQKRSTQKNDSLTKSHMKDEHRRKISKALRASWARRLANVPSPLELERRRKQSEAIKAAHARQSAEMAYF